MLADELFDPARKISREGYIHRVKKTLEESSKIPGNVGTMKREQSKLLSDYMVQTEEGRKRRLGKSSGGKGNN